VQVTTAVSPGLKTMVETWVEPDPKSLQIWYVP